MIDLYTQEGENLPSIPWNVYPRPQLKRNSFFCLNGQWDFSFGSPTYDRKITVPFVPESLLSGINEIKKDGEELFYKREFSLPSDFNVGRVLLHFGAVDQIASVYLNGTFVCHNTGGYNHFFCDVTEHLRDGANELSVIVKDELDLRYPYGKQSKKRGGMWYTVCSGIWQTVWLESVPETYIKNIDMAVDLEKAQITCCGVSDGTVLFEGNEIPLVDGKCELFPKNPVAWTPETPMLYYFTVKSGLDTVESYFALRTLSVENFDGIPRMCLNGKPYFFNGVLDQGYFSDGIFTPATEKGYENDILLMKEAGFNMLRKHIKVEPEQFYYDCDRLGMVVFQDAVNNGEYSFFRDTALPTAFGPIRLNDKLLNTNPIGREYFERGLKNMVLDLKNHPCICLWTIFNEGWGQFCSDRQYDLLRALDDTRFIDTASGWFKPSKTDVESRHVYFRKIRLRKSKKPLYLSEYGGYVFSVAGHRFNPDNEYGYKKFSSAEALEDALCHLFNTEIAPLIEKGLCAAVYTQLSDVEDETNGLVTYDRRVKKFTSRLKEACDKLKIPN